MLLNKLKNKKEKRNFTGGSSTDSLIHLKYEGIMFLLNEQKRCIMHHSCRSSVWTTAHLQAFTFPHVLLVYLLDHEPTPLCYVYLTCTHLHTPAAAASCDSFFIFQDLFTQTLCWVIPITRSNRSKLAPKITRPSLQRSESETAWNQNWGRLELIKKGPEQPGNRSKKDQSISRPSPGPGLAFGPGSTGSTTSLWLHMNKSRRETRPAETVFSSCWASVPCSEAPSRMNRGFGLCGRPGQTVHHLIISRHVPFPSRSASCCRREDLKIELSIRRRVRHRWDSNRHSGGLIIVIYQNQHFETAAEHLWDWKPGFNHRSCRTESSEVNEIF